MDARRHPDDPAAVECDGEVMARVGEEFGRQRWVDRMIEHVTGGTRENGCVVRAGQTELHYGVSRTKVMLSGTPP